MGFMKSKEFAIAAGIALVLVGGALAVYSTGVVDPVASFRKGCDVPAPLGTTLAAGVDDTGAVHDGSHVRRTITYSLNTTLANATIDACSRVGDVTVRPAAGAANVTVAFTISMHDGPGVMEAVNGAKASAAFARDGDTVSLAAWQDRVPRVESLFDGRTGSVDVTIHVPADGNHTAKLTTDVGDIEVSRLAFARLDVATDVGDIDVTDARVTDLVAGTDVGDVTARDLDVGRDLTVLTDVGDIDLRLAGVGNGRLDVTSDVGDIDLTVPNRVDAGYDVDAVADVGDVDVDIGDTESMNKDSEGAGESVQARSQGWSEKLIKVRVEVVADVGSVTVLAR